MKKFGIIILVLTALLAAGSALAQTQDYRFHWAPSPLVDGEGNARPAAVEYQVYLSRDGAADEMIAKVLGDTTFTLAAEPGIVHRIRVAGVDAAGNVSAKSAYSDPIFYEETRGTGLPPAAAALQQNYPNPFNPETKVVYGIPTDINASDRVGLDIFSLDGRHVRTLEVDPTPGWHEVVWDGTDDRGRTQATGMYVQRLVVGTMVETRKMTMVK